MQIAVSDEDITAFMEVINRYEQEHPILIDKYLVGKEVEVDAVCDGTDILIPGIMEHVERAGIHSGDSISVYPARDDDDYEYLQKFSCQSPASALLSPPELHGFSEA